jgi:MFS family permease
MNRPHEGARRHCKSLFLGLASRLARPVCPPNAVVRRRDEGHLRSRSESSVSKGESEMNVAAPTHGDRRAAAWLGVVQFFFVTTWTVYAIYLPKLLTAAGLPPGLTPWILMIDQLIFAGMDVVMGFAADRVRTTLGKLGPMIAAITALSCLAFLLMPHAASMGLGAWPLVLLILVWTVTASALRAPLWVMTSRFSQMNGLRWINVAGLTGIAIGGALAPYLGVALANVGPALPFALSSATLLFVMLGAVALERRIVGAETADAAQAGVHAAMPAALRVFLIGFFLFALGFQVHSALNSGPQYLRFAAKDELPYLLPLFWVGFNLAMFPGAYWAARFGELRVMAAAAGVGALGTLASAQAGSLDMLVAGQLVAGGAWGCAFLAGLSAAFGFGRTGREGAALGLLFAALALATMARIFAVTQKWDKAPELAALLASLPTGLWVAGCLAFLVCYRMQGTPGAAPSESA